MALSSILILPETDRLHGRVPHYEAAPLVPVARITSDPTVLVVPAAIPALVREAIRVMLARAAMDPNAIRALATAGSPVAYLDRAAFEAFIREDAARPVE